MVWSKKASQANVPLKYPRRENITDIPVERSDEQRNCHVRYEAQLRQGFVANDRLKGPPKQHLNKKANITSGKILKILKGNTLFNLEQLGLQTWTNCRLQSKMLSDKKIDL